MIFAIATGGVDPFAVVVPMAHIGIARTRASRGDVDGSRRAYEDLFAIWRGADADFEALAAARAEYGGLTPTVAAGAGRR